MMFYSFLSEIYIIYSLFLNFPFDIDSQKKRESCPLIMRKIILGVFMLNLSKNVWGFFSTECVSWEIYEQFLGQFISAN